jgi:hypothetical protein
MLKRIFFVLVLIFIISLLSVSVFAVDPEKSGKNDTFEEKTPIITITRPSSDGEKTFNKAYTICGITDKSNIRIELFKRKSDGSYTEFKGVDGSSSWDVGPSGGFSIDIMLSLGYINHNGINNFKIKAFDKEKPENVESYTISITLLDVNKLKNEPAKVYSLDTILKPLSK